MNSHFEHYRAELDALNLKTRADLENLVRPLISDTTKIEVQKASRPPENSQLNSHFGGQPYFETGEEWPKTKDGEHLAFIFQIFNTPALALPEHIALVQFFYDWEAFPWDTEDDGWAVKVYKTLAKDKAVCLEKPRELEKSKYCEIAFKPTKTLPDWEGISVYENNASKLSCVLDENEPWGSYREIVTALIGEQDYQSQLGGYPNWVQGESTPTDKHGNPMQLLFQIDSEDNAGLMWGDVGLIYVFHDQSFENIEFILQCH